MLTCICYSWTNDYEIHFGKINDIYLIMLTYVGHYMFLNLQVKNANHNIQERTSDHCVFIVFKDILIFSVEYI